LSYCFHYSSTTTKQVLHLKAVVIYFLPLELKRSGKIFEKTKEKSRSVLIAFT